MSTKATPGPWSVQLPAPDQTQIRVVDRRILKFANSRIADIQYWSSGERGPNREEAFANARLIAASPRMFEALKMAESELLGVLDSINLEKVHHDGDDFHETLRHIYKAIAAATGEAA